MRGKREMRGGREAEGGKETKRQHSTENRTQDRKCETIELSLQAGIEYPHNLNCYFQVGMATIHVC